MNVCPLWKKTWRVGRSDFLFFLFFIFIFKDGGGQLFWRSIYSRGGIFGYFGSRDSKIFFLVESRIPVLLIHSKMPKIVTPSSRKISDWKCKRCRILHHNIDKAILYLEKRPLKSLFYCYNRHFSFNITIKLSNSACMVFTIYSK